MTNEAKVYVRDLSTDNPVFHKPNPLWDRTVCGQGISWKSDSAWIPVVHATKFASSCPTCYQS